MSKVIAAIILTLATIAVRSTIGGYNNNPDIDQDALLDNCNRTYPLPFEEFDALNVSGSFMDEDNKTYKCYILCVIHSMGISNEDASQFFPVRAGVVLALERNGHYIDDFEETTIRCMVRPEKCPCEIAYQYFKCLMANVIEKYDPPREK